MSDDRQPETDRPELNGAEAESVEAESVTDAAASDTLEQALDGAPEATAEEEEAAAEETPEEIEIPAQPAPKLERLQKILAQAGIASRRHAEELITQGRVQVNGQVVTELGSKADAARDHIRVDGKLLQGSERLRYFMLNKPKGYVTTVSDPEGRPTIMEFFTKTRERLYPVGRLDYLSEGLLLVTNDGELANKLTRAASGVEKTYLVKVSGEPAEEDLDKLREGVSIHRGEPGSGRVQTAPAQIRKVRQGDNPWYEVVLIEGRNRELRKMFEEIGHHVEKIRRVGYGPLVLDLEPGNIRELEEEEIENLRKAAEGKYRKPKAKEPRARSGPKPAFSKPRRAPYGERRAPERKEWGQGRSQDRRQGPGEGRGPGRTEARGEGRREFRPSRPFEDRSTERPPRRQPGFEAGPSRGRFDKSRTEGDRRPGGERRFGSRPPRPDFQRREERGEDRGPARGRFGQQEGRPATGTGPKSGGKRPFGARPPRPDFRRNEEREPARDFKRPFPPKRGAQSRNRSAEEGEQRPPFKPSFKPNFKSGSKPRFADRGPEEPRRSQSRPSSAGRARTEGENRPERPSRGPSAPRSGGFGRSGGGRGRNPNANPGSVRSGGGRRSGPGSNSRPRPGSRPSSKPGSKPGSRPGRPPSGGKRRG